MPHVCRVCSRINPQAARYCHYDGAALADDGQAGPIAVGASVFLTPFVFPSGKRCKSFNELILACEADWQAAREMLARGFFEAFLGGMGRADLALAARRAAEASDADRALDALLAQLPGERLPGVLAVAPREINFGRVKRSDSRSFMIHIENVGMGLLSGNAQSEVPWLALGDAAGAGSKVFQCRHELDVAVQLVGKALRAHPKPQEGRIAVTAGNITCAVVVRVEVLLQPFPDGVLAGATTPRQVAEKARTAPREAGRLFESGAVARWYESNGWDYPVEGKAASGMAAVQQFFEALGLTRPPRVVIGQNSVELAGAPGGNVEAFVFVESLENRPIYAHVSSETPWIQIGKARSQGNTVRVHLRVPSVPPLPGQRLQGQAIITTNGNQRFPVQVTLNIADIPVPPAPPAPKPVPLAAPPADLPPLPAAAPSLPPLPVAIEVKHDGTPLVLAAEVQPPPRDRVSQLEAVHVHERVEEPPQRRPSERDGRPPAGQRTRRREHPAPARDLGWHLIPLLAVLVILAGIVLHDFLLPARPGQEEERDDVARIDPTPLVELHFNDRPRRPDEPKYRGKTMMFGLSVREPDKAEGGKRLMYEPLGRTNNVCVRIDGSDYLFGHDDAYAPHPGQEFEPTPGVSRWVDMRAELGKDADGRPREGAKSVWEVIGLREKPCKVQVTQTVEIVAGSQSRQMDTCIIRYTLHNRDARAHKVGLRFLLDTFIGENDGVPFTIPGKPGLCSTRQRFDAPSDVPDYIQALEKDNLLSPGTVAHLQFRIPGPLEAPTRVQLGGYPDGPLRQLNFRLANSWLTPWEVPFVNIRELVDRRAKLTGLLREPEPDSAVTLYWQVKPLEPGQRREVGFAYGLGSFASAEGEGKLLLTVGGRTVRDGEFTLTALRSAPVAGENLSLILPGEERFELLSPAEQEVPPVVEGSARPISTVTWRLRARREGRSTLVVRSSVGVSQKQTVRIVSPPTGLLD
jgi:hypothetical protein